MIGPMIGSPGRSFIPKRQVFLMHGQCEECRTIACTVLRFRNVARRFSARSKTALENPLSLCLRRQSQETPRRRSMRTPRRPR